MTNLHITKDEINRLPMKQYEGPIHLIRTPDDAERAAVRLKKETLLGFDTETRPTFRVGEYYQPSLLQLATGTEVFLFQIKLTGLTSGLCEVLSSLDIIKTGVSIRSDVSELRKLTAFEPAGFVELAEHAKRAHIKNLGLRGLAALLLGFRVSKREQTSNWAKNELTESQIRYAATDAWLGREIYRHMDGLGLIKS
ncbi:MAG: 3'-5' exonuclease domain-containing protein 2 [Kiritimatiellaceae bacterium]|nr:3'-5' exonuclease domain-containing protein 2 [Kiritimatiellaceae bacterium]